MSVKARTRILDWNEEWSTSVTKWIISKGDDKEKGTKLFEEWRGNRIVHFLSGSIIEKGIEVNVEEKLNNNVCVGL